MGPLRSRYIIGGHSNLWLSEAVAKLVLWLRTCAEFSSRISATFGSFKGLMLEAK
jgi:hypothetical protein